MDDGLISWRELLAETTERLASADVDEAVVSARRIVEEASGWDGAEFSLHLEDPATERSVAHLDSMVARRLQGEPVQYIVGRWGFRSLDLFIDHRALIPRPETEEVAGWAIDEARQFDAPIVADLGTGSGAIGLSVATEIETSLVHLTDVSDEALSVARANLTGAGQAASRVSAHLGHWFEAMPAALRGELHVIVSNPPYVTDGEELPPVVDHWEPALALRGGPTGLRHIETIVDEAHHWLISTGSLVVEMAPDQTEVVAERCRARGYTEVEIRTDLAGRARAVIARTS